MEEKEHKEYTICDGAHMMETPKELILCIEESAAWCSDILPHQESPHEETKVEHAQDHRTRTRTLSPASPDAVGNSREQPERPVHE